MKNIMLDLETMGVSANSAIVAIGAVEFDKDLGIIDRFYETVDLQSCIDKGLDVDGGTVIWWMKQSEEARRALTKDNIPLKEALQKFRDWMGKGNVKVWGNGSDFDNTILINAFQKFRVMAPWPYHSNRCYRTLRYSFPSFDMERVGTHHNAVDDAEYQAKYLIELVKKNKLGKVL